MSAVDPTSNVPDTSGPNLPYLGGVRPVPGAGGGAGGAGGSTDYDPSVIQQQIDLILEEYKNGKPMPESVITYLMYLMQEYGLQVVGQDAKLQSNVNQYMGQIHELYNDLNAANGWSPSSGTPDPSIDFKNTLDSLLKSLSTDGFFTTGQGSQMASQIKEALSGLEGFVSGASGGAGDLENLWARYNGTATGLTAGDPAAMTSMTSYLGEITQQYTGLSASIKATTTSDSALQSTEQDTMNNWLKKLNSVNLYFLQQQKTQ